MQEVWGVLQALGNITFAHSFSNVLIAIQDTIKAPPSEATVRKPSIIVPWSPSKIR